MLIELAKIRKDGGTQPRQNTNYETVEEYREAMERGENFPSLRVVFDGENYWLVDGYHRIEAAEQLDRESFECEVVQGTQTDAQWMSFGVNSQHGLRRTRWDVQRAITAALQHPMSAGFSDRMLADHIHCDHKTVGVQRKKLEMSGEVPHKETRTGSDGRVVNIGKSAPAPEPVEQIKPPEGGWPEMEDGVYPTELAEPIFENRGHAQAVIHVLEIEPKPWQNGRRFVANAALVGVSACELSLPLNEDIARGAKEEAIAMAAECLAVHILRCLQNGELLESRRSALVHFLCWTERQGADGLRAAGKLEAELRRREAFYASHAKELLFWLGELIDPRLPPDRQGHYDWPKEVTALLGFTEADAVGGGEKVREIVDYIDAIELHFALIVAGIRGFKARQVAA